MINPRNWSGGHLVSNRVKIIYASVGESGGEITESCNRFLQSLVGHQPDKTADLIYKLSESIQKEGDESVPSTEETFRAWWNRYIQWPTYRNHPEDCVLGLNHWFPKTAVSLARNVVLENSIALPGSWNDHPEMGDNHEMEFVDETEESYKSMNLIRDFLEAKGWRLALPPEKITLEVTRAPAELRRDFLSRSVSVLDEELQQLLGQVEMTIGGIAPEVENLEELSNAEEFLVRRMFGEKVNAMAMDVGVEGKFKQQVDETTRGAALRFGFLRKRNIMDYMKERVDKFLERNLGNS